jgi:hypothetical protein
MARIRDITDAVTKAIITQGTIVQVPEGPKRDVDTSPILIKKYFERALISARNVLDENSTSIEHTFPHSSFTNEKLTLTALVDLIYRVKHILG